MAKSGFIDVKATNYDIVRFKWDVTGQSRDYNESYITWQLLLIADENGAIYSTYDKVWEVTINGIKKSGTNTVGIYANATKTLASGTQTIPHNADGTKTFTFSFMQAFAITFGNNYIAQVKGSGAGTLDSLPREAKILSAPDFTDEENPTITYTNPGGAIVEACISLTGASDDIAAYRQISSAAGSYTFVLTDEERARIYEAMTGTKSRTIRFYLRSSYTYSSQRYFNWLEKRVTIVNAEPKMAVEYYDRKDGAQALTGNNKTFIRYHNDLYFNITAETFKGASIIKYQITNGAQVANGNPDVIYDADNESTTFAVIDSRGNKAEITEQLNLIPYVDLTCNLSNVLLNTANTLNFTLKGDCYIGTLGAVDNALTLQYRYKDETNNGSFTSWHTITPTITGGSYSASVATEGLDYRATYTLEIKATDKVLNTLEDTQPIIITYTINSYPVFDWGKEDFNFNVPVSIQGAPIADFIVEEGTDAMGTNGTWYWRKWNSGRAECYGLRNYGNMGVSTAWGSLYRSAIFTQPLPSGLFISNPEYIGITLASGSYGGWIAMHEEEAPSYLDTGSFIVVRPASATITAAHIGFNVIGRWK